MEKMVEKAKEELEMLEKLHPNRFDYLKLELKSFISLLQSQHPSPSSSTATTQASTSMKRKRGSLKRIKTQEEEDERLKFQSTYQKKKKKVIKASGSGRDRVDVVLEKAQACLRKIKDVKFSLLC